MSDKQPDAAMPEHETPAGGAGEPSDRVSAHRMTDLVLQLLQGAPLATVSRNSQVPAERLERWKRIFVEEGARALQLLEEFLEESDTGSRDKETILLVEDDEAVRKMVRHNLERHGYRVLEACFSSEAYIVAHGYKSPIHLMVTDVMMPGTTGPVLANKLMIERPEMKVIYMSGWPEEVVRETLGETEKATFLYKDPLLFENLPKTVREVLDAPARFPQAGPNGLQ